MGGVSEDSDEAAERARTGRKPSFAPSVGRFEGNNAPRADDPEVLRAAQEQRRQRGRAANLLTGGQGLAGLVSGSARRTLMGI